MSTLRRGIEMLKLAQCGKMVSFQGDELNAILATLAAAPALAAENAMLRDDLARVGSVYDFAKLEAENAMLRRALEEWRTARIEISLAKKDTPECSAAFVRLGRAETALSDLAVARAVIAATQAPSGKGEQGDG